MSAPSHKQALGRLTRTQLSAPSLLACRAHWPTSSAASKTVMSSHNRIQTATQTLASCICDTGCDDGPVAARSATSCSCKPLRLSCNHAMQLTKTNIGCLQRLQLLFELPNPLHCIRELGLLLIQSFVLSREQPQQRCSFKVIESSQPTDGMHTFAASRSAT